MQDASDHAAATFMHFSSWIISAVASSLDEAISFCSTSDPDKEDSKKLTQMKGYEGFTLSSKMFTNIWQRHWSQINPHELLYDLEYNLMPTRAIMFQLPKTRWWDAHVQNSQSGLIYDKWLNATFGFDNGVFTTSRCFFSLGKMCCQRLKQK